MEASNSGGVSFPRNPNDRVKLNVGGKLFETTVLTLQSGGTDSLLAALSLRAASAPRDDPLPIFIDRDPEIFSALLSLLRSGCLPSAALRSFSKQDLIDEALFYGVDGRLRSALSPPPLVGFDAVLASTIRPASDAIPTALSAGFEDGSVWVAHGGQISAYDWSLAHAGTIRTHLDEITALGRVWPEVAATGSLESPGLHFYDVSGGQHVGSVHWADPGDPRIYKARVTAIAAGWSSNDPLYAAFECPHRENCILAVDLATLGPAETIGRQNGGAAKTASPGRLVNVRERGLIFAAAVSAGAFGYAGYMRLWDPRSGKAVWETSEPGGGSSTQRFGDAFSDVDVDREGSAIYKVCWRSGDVAVADMRRLGEDPWVYLEDNRSAAAGVRIVGEGVKSVIHCYKQQVFVGKEGGLEVWSQITDGEEGKQRKEEGVSVGATYRRNFVDKEEDAKRGRIGAMEAGGNRLFVSRIGVEGVEVWESSDLAGAISIL
ncbi:protein ENDOPLASMIC RETICULUM-ARRESTED PEN3 [Curcuma longa]|uniref:protein ENDOPLASMIC RETICULUM-ARRESTED PEN3 n=1 Tax=Curcuma longa TaxID=136217 RepID=UPI003D9F842E